MTTYIITEQPNGYYITDTDRRPVSGPFKTLAYAKSWLRRNDPKATYTVVA